MYFTEGIILKKNQYREADYLITVLTKDFGKIRLLAGGVRKQGAKLKGHCEALTHSSIGFVAGKNYYRMTSADMKQYHSNIRVAPELLAAAYSVARLIDVYTFEEREDPRLFEIFRAFLEELDTGRHETREEKKDILYRFYTAFLDVLGLLPEPAPLHASAIDILLATHLGFKTEPLLV